MLTNIPSWQRSLHGSYQVHEIQLSCHVYQHNALTLSKFASLSFGVKQHYLLIFQLAWAYTGHESNHFCPVHSTNHPSAITACPGEIIPASHAPAPSPHAFLEKSRAISRDDNGTSGAVLRGGSFLTAGLSALIRPINPAQLCRWRPRDSRVSALGRWHPPGGRQ